MTSKIFPKKRLKLLTLSDVKRAIKPRCGLLNPLFAVRRRADGTILLQAQGAPGQSFDVQASTNLATCQDLGSITA
jgi:hypothetical protein